MEINLFREITTVGAFLCFLAIVIWAWGRPAQNGFKEASMQPIEDIDTPTPQWSEKK